MAPGQPPQIGGLASQQLQNSVAPLAGPNNVANLISALDGPTLQKLLGALQQQQQQPSQQQPAAPPATAVPNSNPAQLSALLAATSQMNFPAPAMPATTNNQMPAMQNYGNPMANMPAGLDPNIAAFLARGGGNQFPNQAMESNPQLHNIINQLTKWRH
jgi:hypothetical protein